MSIKTIWETVEKKMISMGFVLSTAKVIQDRRFTIDVGPVISEQEKRGGMYGGKVATEKELSVLVMYKPNENDTRQMMKIAEDAEKIILSLDEILQSFMFISAEITVNPDHIQSAVKFSVRDQLSK